MNTQSRLSHKMLGLLITALVIFNLAQAGVVPSSAAIPKPQDIGIEDGAWRPVIVRHDPTPSTYRVPAPAQFSRLGVKSATIMINYQAAGETAPGGEICLTWPNDAKVAFDYAASIWESLINSSVPIVVNACWTRFSEAGVLGYGGSGGYSRDFTGAPRSNTWYPVSLANALSNTDRNGSDPEIFVAYSADFDWYFGTDGNTPVDEMDFASIVLHELCHGLGFAGSMTVDQYVGYWAWGAPSPNDYPVIYDRYAENGSGQSLISFGNGTTALATQLTSNNVYFDGPYAGAANGGSPPKLFAPSTWMPGSSYSHLDYDTFNDTPNTLMVYAISDGESEHDPGSITLGLLEDIGWTITSAAPAPTVNNITPSSGPNEGQINITDLSGADFQTGATVKLTRSGQADINATNVNVVSDDQITCALNLTGAEPGAWNVVVTNPDAQSGTLPNGFTVTFSGKTWNGSVSNDWHTVDNWSPTGIPTSGDHVLIPDVTRDPVISNDSAAVNSLTINKGAVLDLTSRTLTVEGTVTNQGTLKHTQNVAENNTTEFLRITNIAGLVKYYGVEITPAGATTVNRAGIPDTPQGNLLIESAKARDADFKFCDGFESGSLNATYWTTYTTNDGQVQVSSLYPYSGTYSVLLDDSVDDSTNSYAAIILTLDLSGQDQVELNFWWREFGDEDHDDDGVFISDDSGTNWYPVLSFNGGPTIYRNDVVDIDAAAATNGLTLNDHFQIKFQFYDNWAITSDGYAIDEVCVQTPLQPDIGASPAVFEESVQLNQKITRTLTLGNTGNYSLTFRIGEQPGSFIPTTSFVSVQTASDFVPADDNDATIFDNVLGRIVEAPISAQSSNNARVSATAALTGVAAFAVELVSEELVFFYTDAPDTLVKIGNIGSGNYYGGDFLGDDFTVMYAIEDTNQAFITIDTATGMATTIGTASPVASDHTWTGMAGDPTSDTLYGASSNGTVSMLYTFDESTGAATLVGEITNASTIIGLAINADGELYGLDIGGDQLVQIDKATGAGTVIGSVGFAANYAQGMDFDQETGILYLAAYDYDSSAAELRIADTSTGNSTVIGMFPSSTELDTLAIATVGKAEGVPWLAEVPTDDVVGAGNTISVDVVFDATGLALGDYTATLIVSSNDTDENPVTIPVTMHVATEIANQPPVLEGLPNQTVPINGSADNAIDLWAYASDDEDADADLDFAITNTPAAGAGVTLDGNRYIDINPTTDWSGVTDVQIQVQDTGGLADTNSFSVTVETLTGPHIQVSPTAFDEAVRPAEQLTRTLTISNTGTESLLFIIGDGGVTWLSEDPASDTVNAGGASSVDIVFDATGLSVGDYTTDLVINSNDSDNSPLTLPVAMHVATNTAPVLSGVPDQIYFINSVYTPLDLWRYASDNESPDDALTFTIDNTPDPNAGITLDANRYIVINPVTGWSGQTTVVVRVTDPEGLSDTDSFLVEVMEQGPNIKIAPTSFEESLEQDTQLNQTLTISNTGTEQLMFVLNDDGTPWLIEDPSSGFVAAGGASSVNVTFDATGLAAGNYNADLTVNSNDPDESAITVPITMHVAGPEGTPVTVSVSGHQFCADRTTGVKRCFDIEAETAMSATVRFYFSEAERNGQILDNLLVWHYNGDWMEEPGPYLRGGAGDAQYVEAQNVDGFSLFALGGKGSLIYLPIISKRWPPLPDIPVLNAISNADGDGNYTVSWNAALLANTYTLQEDDNASFSSPTTAYGPGTATSTSITNKPTGIYYYRVKATNSYGDSGWSNVQSVQVSPPTKLYATEDAMVIQRLPSNNLGNTTDMWVGYGKGACIGSSSDPGVTRSLVKFNLSAIPAGTSISSARLYLRLGGWCRGSNTNSRPVTVYRTSGGWSESSVIWNNMPGIGEAYGSTAVGYPSSATWYSFDVTNLVRGWVNGSLPNYGMTLRGPEGSGSDFAWFGFFTSESSYDPYLDITYAGVTTTKDEAQAVEDLMVPFTCGITIEDMLDTVSGVTHCGMFEFAGQTVCTSD